MENNQSKEAQQGDYAIRKFIYIFLFLCAVLFISVFVLFRSSDSEIKRNLINQTSSYLGYVQSTSISLAISLGYLFVTAIIILCIYYIMKDIEQTIVLPFETNDKDLNGRVISDMIIAELRRIKDIHESNKTEGLKVAKSERLPVPREDPSELVLGDDLKRLEEELGEVSAAISDVSMFKLSGIEIPISSLILSINRLRRPGRKGCTIHGTVQKCGSRVHIEVHIKKLNKQNNTYFLNCQIERNLKNGDISELMRDLAYKIAFELYDENYNEKAPGEFEAETKNTEISEPEHLKDAFNWTDVKSKNYCGLKNFLKDIFGQWVESADINEDKTIEGIIVSSVKEKLELEYKNNEIILKIYDPKTSEFVVTDKFKAEEKDKIIKVRAPSRLNNIDEYLNSLHIPLIDLKIKAEKLKCKLDVCQRECFRQNKMDCVEQQNRSNYNWLFEVNDLLNPEDVINKILYEVYPIPYDLFLQYNPMSFHILDSFSSQFNKLNYKYNKYRSNHSRGKEDLNDCLVYLLNTVIKKENLYLNFKNFLRPETIKFGDILAKNKNVKTCFLLNRLLLEELLDIKLEQQTARVRTWDELKNITESLDSYSLHMRSKQKEALDRAYAHCNYASESRSKIFFGVFYNIAIAYFEIADYDKAGNMFQNAAQIKPIASAHAGRGICLKYRTRFREAIKEFEYAICCENVLASLTPEEAARSKVRRYAASLPELHPNCACFDYSSLSTSWDLFGGIYLDLGFYVSELYDKAIVGFYEALKRDPISPYPWLWLGVAYYRKSAISYRNAQRNVKDAKLRADCIKKAKDDNDIALKLISKAIDLGRTQGLKDFATSPMCRAACLRLNFKICDLYQRHIQKIKHIDSFNDLCERKERSVLEREACEILATISISDAYNRACHESLDGRTSEALRDLKIALDTRRISRVQALFDPDIYIFSSNLERFLKSQQDDKEIIKDIKYIFSREDKYIQASFEAAARNKKEAVRLLLEKRKEIEKEAGKACEGSLGDPKEEKISDDKFDDMLKGKKENILSDKLREDFYEKFNLDPNFYFIQNIAVIVDIFPVSPEPRSHIDVNIQIINTHNDGLENICMIFKIPEGLIYVPDNNNENPSGEYIKRRLGNLDSWKKINIHLRLKIEHMDCREYRIKVIARGKTKDRIVGNYDLSTIKTQTHLGSK